MKHSLDKVSDITFHVLPPSFFLLFLRKRKNRRKAKEQAKEREKKRREQNIKERK